jgi:hypothetical protein
MRVGIIEPPHGSYEWYDNYAVRQIYSTTQLGKRMASPIIAVLEAEVTRATTVMGSAVILIEGIAARIQTAIDAALEAGATAAQLADLQDEVDAVKAASDALSAAVAANTV